MKRGPVDTAGGAKPKRQKKGLVPPGTQCWGLFSANNEWYKAVITHAEPDPKHGYIYRVRYTKYGNEEERTRNDIMTNSEMAEFKSQNKASYGKATVIMTTSTTRRWEDGMPTGQGDTSQVTLSDGLGMFASGSDSHVAKIPEPPLTQMLELGTSCWGQYQVDKIWYACEIIEIERCPSDKSHPFLYTVKYHGYGNQEKLQRQYIKMNQPHQTPKTSITTQTPTSDESKVRVSESTKSAESTKLAESTEPTESTEAKEGGEIEAMFEKGELVIMGSERAVYRVEDGVVVNGKIKISKEGNDAFKPITADPNALKVLVCLDSVDWSENNSLKKSQNLICKLKDASEKTIWTQGVVFQNVSLSKEDSAKNLIKVMLPKLAQLKSLPLSSLFFPKGESLLGFEGGASETSGMGVVLHTRAGFMANKNNPGKRKQNQDRGVIIRGGGGDPDIDIFGVLDGHGDDGHFVSEYVKKSLGTFFTKNIDSASIRKSPEGALAKAVDYVVKKLKAIHKKTEKSLPKFDVNTSGTTLCLTLRIGRSLLTINIGDSRAVLFKTPKQKHRNDSKSNSGIEAVAMSRDHKPSDPDERKRIITAGGRCAQLGPNQPMRVLPRHANFPGLAVSRSVGDFWGEPFGLKALPEYKHHTLKTGDLFMVWASDGIWEWLSNQQVANIVYQNIHDLEKASKLLVDQARLMWDKNTKGTYHDDITAVIVKF